MDSSVSDPIRNREDMESGSDNLNYNDVDHHGESEFYEDSDSDTEILAEHVTSEENQDEHEVGALCSNPHSNPHF